MPTPNFQRRNEAVRNYVEKLTTQYPHWKFDFIVGKTAEKFYLSTRTIEAILKEEGVYAK